MQGVADVRQLWHVTFSEGPPRKQSAMTCTVQETMHTLCCAEHVFIRVEDKFRFSGVYTHLSTLGTETNNKDHNINQL